jgi:hypothetical protein
VSAKTLKDRVEDVRRRLAAAFPLEPVPRAEQIVSHQCEECEGVRDTFSGLTWDRVTPKHLTEKLNLEALPLFTDVAHGYYLPAYLLFALTPAGDTLLDFAIYDLSTEESERWERRIGTLSTAQREALLAWLLLVLDFRETFGPDGDRAIEAVDRIRRTLTS